LTNNYAIGGQGGQGAAGGTGAAGAIFTQNGSLVLIGVSMWSNEVTGGSGGECTFCTSPRGGHGLGGAVYSTNSSVLVMNSDLSSNTCTTIAGGDRLTGNGSTPRFVVLGLLAAIPSFPADRFLISKPRHAQGVDRSNEWWIDGDKCRA
jgi:hypothetical protein